MFDKTFLKFAIGFGAVIAVSLCALYVTGYMSRISSTSQTASASVRQ